MKNKNGFLKCFGECFLAVSIYIVIIVVFLSFVFLVLWTVDKMCLNPNSMQQKDVRLNSQSYVEAKTFVAKHCEKPTWSDTSFCSWQQKFLTLADLRVIYMNNLLKNDKVLHDLVQISVKNSVICNDTFNATLENNQSVTCTAIKIQLNKLKSQQEFEIQPFEIQNQYKNVFYNIEAIQLINSLE